jgi:DNA-binding transcriptional LysR family regulator
MMRRWRGVHLRHLVGFEAIVRTGSFQRAADDLGYAQTAISQQLAQLERLVGARLIERASGSGEISLTPAGRVLLWHARKVRARLDAAQVDIASLRRARVVRVGAHPSLAGPVERTTSRLAAFSPRLDVRVIDTWTEAEMAEALAHGEIDLACCRLPPPGGQLDWTEVVEDRFVLLAPTHGPIAERLEAPSAEQLGQMPLVALDVPGVHECVTGWMRAHGVAAEPIVRCDASSTVQGVVAQGAGVAILPRSCVDSLPGATVVELPDAPSRLLGLCWHRERGRPPAAEALAEALRAEMERR